jgi:hypothetical protein
MPDRLAVVIPAPVVPRVYGRELLRHWTDDQWAAVPVTALRMDLIVPTQVAVSIEAVGRWVNNPDTLPARVVYDQGRYWLHDGHTRWLIKSLAGDRYIDAHIVDPQGRPVTDA